MGGGSRLGMLWRKVVYGGEWYKQSSGQHKNEWYKWEVVTTSFKTEDGLTGVNLTGRKIFSDAATPRTYVEAGAGITEGGAIDFQVSKALGVGFKMNKKIIKDYGYRNDTETGFSKPNGNDATAIGANAGIGYFGLSYDINKVYNKNGTFSTEQVIGIGCFRDFRRRSDIKS